MGNMFKEAVHINLSRVYIILLKPDSISYSFDRFT